MTIQNKQGLKIRKSPIIGYGALLLISATIIAGVAARLLSHEQTRLDRAVLETERGRLKNRAEQISMAIGAVQDELTRALKAIPPEEREETLRDWEHSNPMVRNVFIWRGPDDLTLPETMLPLTREEDGFLARYKTLFSGLHDWNDQRRSEEQTTTRSRYDTWGKSSFVPPSASGWMPWYWENNLYMLGWVIGGADGTRYGIELEQIALLAELFETLPKGLPEGQALALVDAGGRAILQCGPLDLANGAQVALSVPVGPALPHWEFSLYTTDGTLPSSTQSVRYLSALLVAILFLILFGAGGMLLKEAHRNRQDALQKTTFVANVSHELKTPLTTIRMYTDLLREGRVRDPEKQTRYLATIASESERLTRLVNNVLDFGRLEQNRKKYQIGRFDLREVVESVTQSQRPRLNEVEFQLTQHLPDAPAMVESDRDAIQQALLNLIDNAIKYAAAGKTLTVELHSGKREHRLTVCDAGPGIPAAHRRKIFERFYRVDDSITARSQGSGLGLSLSQRMLIDLGGSLTYSPAPKGGACFTITLPEAV